MQTAKDRTAYNMQMHGKASSGVITEELTETEAGQDA
jgi:hypothetical protein